MHHFEENSKDPLEETRDKETQRLTRHKLSQKIRTWIPFPKDVILRNISLLQKLLNGEGPLRMLIQ